jgi:uncharacterized protein YuzE
MVWARYDPEADVPTIVLWDAPLVDAFEEPRGILIRYGEDAVSEG